MNYKVVLGILLALTLIAVPVAADSSVLDDIIKSTTDSTGSDVEDPVVDDGEQKSAYGTVKYGYLNVSDVIYELYKEDATITVEYTIEPWMSFLVLFFGKDDLQKRILELLQYPEPGAANQTVNFTYVDGNKAVLEVTNAATDNQAGSYWFKAREFDCIIPYLTFICPNETKNFIDVKKMSKGFGYFS